jgi:hypothetical protein
MALAKTNAGIPSQAILPSVPPPIAGHDEDSSWACADGGGSFHAERRLEPGPLIVRHSFVELQ